MHGLISRGSRLVALTLLVVPAVSSCDSSSGPTPPSVAPSTAPAPVLEIRVGTVRAHQAAYVNFSMMQAGLVTLKIEPVLLLTLRSGKAPEEFGQFITNSDNGGLTFPAPAGTNSVVIGNPFDEDKAFTLTITHPS